jgi:hypothetical protein
MTDEHEGRDFNRPCEWLPALPDGDMPDIEIIWKDRPGLAEAEREYEACCAALMVRLNAELEKGRYLSERHQLEMHRAAKLAFINDPERNLRFQDLVRLMNHRTIDRVIVRKGGPGP